MHFEKCNRHNVSINTKQDAYTLLELHRISSKVDAYMS